MLPPFTIGGSTVTVSATTTSSTSSRQAIGAKTSPPGAQIIVQAPAGNTVAVFIKIGSSTVAAAVTDFPLLPGAIMAFSIGPDQTHIAGITASSTGTVYVTPGMGA